MKKILSLLLCSIFVNVISAQDFDNVTMSAGIDHSYVFTPPSFHGGGASFVDFDNDGWDDITLATKEESDIHFYKNNANGTFSRIFFPGIEVLAQTKQVIWVDIDNDGDKDFYSAGFRFTNRLFENLGNMTFEDISLSAGLDLEEESTYGTSFGDINNDGWLDFHVVNFALFGERNSLLYKNNGDNTFTEISISAGVRDIHAMPFCSTFIDFDKDGWQDIYIAQDKDRPNVLLRNNGNETFTDMSEETGLGHILEAMCVTPGDFDNDDDIDIYVTNAPDPEGNHLFQNNGDQTFTDVAPSVGLEVDGFCWGSNFFDVENDGDLDIYVSCQWNNNFENNSDLYINNGLGNFALSSPVMPNDTMTSFSNAIGDFNNDGFADIIVNNHNTPSILWKNNNDSGNWIKVNLEGTVSNRDGIGSKIEMYSNGNKQLRYTYCGEGFIAQNANHEIFGLGNESEVDSLVVTWLSGIQDHIYNISSNQEILVIEGDHPVGMDDIEELPFSLVQVSSGELLQINFENPILDFIELRIIQINGQQLFDQRIRSYNTQQLELDISSLPSGFYILELNIGGNFYAKEFSKF